MLNRPRLALLARGPARFDALLARAAARPERWPLLPMIMSLALGLWGIGYRQMWQDEYATWWAAALSWSDLGRLFGTVDVVLAPYYALMHGWIALFGSSARALRMPSTLALAICALAVAWLGKRLFGAREGLLAGLIFAWLPSVAFYAHEARPYGLAMLATVLSALALLRALEAPERARSWLLYALSVAGIGAAHLVSLCALFAHAAWVLSLRWRPAGALPWHAVLLRFALALALGLLPVLPLALLGSGQSGQVSWIKADWEHLAAYPGQLFYSDRFALTVSGLALLACVRLRSRALLLAVWAVFPPLFLFATFTQLGLFLTRYLLFTLPALAVLAGVGLCILWDWLKPWPRATLALALVVLFVDGQSGLRDRLPQTQRDFRGAANRVRENMQPGDAITFEGPSGGRMHLRVAFHYYFRKPPPEFPRDVFVERSAQEVGYFLPALCADSAACLPADVSRLWLVTSARRDDIFEGMNEERVRLLQSEFSLTELKTKHKVCIALFTRNPKPGAALPAVAPSFARALRPLAQLAHAGYGALELGSPQRHERRAGAERVRE